MIAAGSVNQQPRAVSRLAALLDLAEDEVDQLEEFFVEATATQGALGRKIFARLRQGASLGEALDVSEDMLEFLYARAYRWLVVAKHQNAEPLFRVLCMLDAESADFWIGLGLCLKARAAWDEALTAFRLASQGRPQWAVPHFHALEVCVRHKKWSKAATELALFDSKADAATPAGLTAEMAKFRKVLRVRAVQSNESHSSAPSTRGSIS